ncbi:MAG: hypothetical protein IPO06_08600 [Leptospiraceae bacterium]|nr:hypothetical protein [Leptospiraceae bacterium]
MKEQFRFYDVASYTLFFPVMIAGPITRFKDVVPKMESPTLTKEDMFEGLWKILLGLTKKLLSLIRLQLSYIQSLKSQRIILDFLFCLPVIFLQFISTLISQG